MSFGVHRHRFAARSGSDGFQAETVARLIAVAVPQRHTCLGLRPPSPGARPDTPAQDTLTADEASATMPGTTDDMLPGIPDGLVPFQHHVLIGQRSPPIYFGSFAASVRSSRLQKLESPPSGAGPERRAGLVGRLEAHARVGASAEVKTTLISNTPLSNYVFAFSLLVQRHASPTCKPTRDDRRRTWYGLAFNLHQRCGFLGVIGLPVGPKLLHQLIKPFLSNSE